MIDTNNKLKTLSADLIASVREVMEKKNTEGTPKTAREKELAAMGHPKDKITHKDVLIGRGVLRKEEKDVGLRVAGAVLNKMRANEEVEQIDEISRETLASYYKKSMTQAAPLGMKKAKADKQTMARIKSGKSLKDYTPKDALSPEEERLLKKRKQGGSRAMNRISSIEKSSAYKSHPYKGGSEVRKMGEEAEQIDENWIGSIAKWKKVVNSTHGDVTYHKNRPTGGSMRSDTIAKNSSGNIVGVYQHHNNMGRVFSKTNEEVEQIDELSPATLGSYIKKATKQIGSKNFTAGYHSATTGTYGSRTDRNKEREELEKADKRERGVRRAVDKLTKEEVEIDEAMNANDRFNHHHNVAKELLKSISQHLAAHADEAKKYQGYGTGKKGPSWGHVGSMESIANQLGSIHDQLARQGEYAKVNESRVDGVAPGSMDNDGHLCATKVFHKEWAEGTPIFSQHAEPDADGNIAWYDVMFEHGIERQVPVSDMDILMAETHERHSRRKMREEVEQVDEAGSRSFASAIKKSKASEERAIKRAVRAVKKGQSVESAIRDHDLFPKHAAIIRQHAGISEEVEDIDERNVENKFKKDLYVAKKGKELMGKGINFAKYDKYRIADTKGHDYGIEYGDDDKASEKHASRKSNLRSYKVLGRAAMKKEEAEDLDEARGRPRKNPLPADQSDEPEARQHIIQQLQRARLSMRGGEHVTFKDGTKHLISKEHADKAIKMYTGMKPNEKADFQNKISSSHKSFKDEIN